MKFGIDWPFGFREEDVCKIMVICIHVYSPVTGADKPLMPLFSLTVLFSQYSPLLQVFLN